MLEPPVVGIPSSLLCEREVNKETGRAIRTTPNSEMYAAICSIRVKGSLMRKEHAQQASEGARKVMTVASASGRYNNESTKH